MFWNLHYTRSRFHFVLHVCLVFSHTLEVDALWVLATLGIPECLETFLDGTDMYWSRVGVVVIYWCNMNRLGYRWQISRYKWPPICVLRRPVPDQAYLGGARTRDWKVAGSNPCWSGGRIFFSKVDFLCWPLFRYPFHLRVTAVACKRSRSFCQKCRWQVTAKHAFTLRMWLCMKWQWAWLYGVHRTCDQTAAVSCGTSHASAVSTPLLWIYIFIFIL